MALDNRDVKVDAGPGWCALVSIVIGAVTVVLADRGNRGGSVLLLVVALLLREGGSREETLGGAVGSDVLEVLPVRDVDEFRFVVAL